MAKVVITVDTEEQVVNIPIIKVEDTATETVSVPATKKKRKKAERLHWAVEDEAILYKIAEAKLLHKMHGINFYGKDTVFFFDKCDEIKAIIDSCKNDSLNEVADSSELHSEDVDVK